MIFNDFKIIFLSITIEGLPFLFIGALVASIIDLFINEKIINRFLPENIFLKMFSVCFLGLIFPLCECAIIPITRKLIKKGVPVNVALVFMLTTPIVNPISILATMIAFKWDLKIVLLRVLLGIFISLIIGFTFFNTKKEDILLDIDDDAHDNHCTCHKHSCVENKVKKSNVLLSIINHTSKEFFNVGVFFILGAAVSALIQTILPLNHLSIIQGNTPLSILSLQLLGYALSLCSHADAFIAAGFIGQFALIAILAFLVISPLIDIKNTIILLGLFKKKFAVSLILRIFILTFIVLFIISFGVKV